MSEKFGLEVRVYENPETGTKNGYYVRQLVHYIDSIKRDIGHIEDGIEEIRNDKEFNVADAEKDQRYSVQVLLTEHKRLTNILENVLDTEIISEELTDRIVKI